MTREEQIREASIDYQLSINPRAIGGDAFADFVRKMNVNPSFIAGAKWADGWWKKRFKEYNITSIGDAYIEVGVTDVFGLKDIASLSPIPLTEEFFEKNGIKKVDYDYLKPNVLFESEDKRIIVTDITNSGDGYWNVHVDNEDFSTIGSCDVKYVHQFQQLLRLCGYEMDVVV